LGEREDAEQYAKIAEIIKSAFNDKFLDRSDVKYNNNTHTAKFWPWLLISFPIIQS
jgi:hypothetical protein